MPRSFHFIAPVEGMLTAVVLLEGTDRSAALGWLSPGPKVDVVSEVMGERERFGLALIDETKLPEPLRLRGVTMDVYADDKPACSGKLGKARLGALGSGLTSRGDDFNSLLVGRSPDLFFEIDLSPDCAQHLKGDGTRVAWARDASLPKPVIVAKAERATTPTVQKDVRRALRLVRTTAPFVESQRLSDFDRAKYGGHPPLPLEQLNDGWNGSAHWTRFSWNGEDRAYFAVLTSCPPPHVHVGFDFRVNAQGAFEVLPGVDRHDPSGGFYMVDPTVLVDVDADGRLEAIEARADSFSLSSFDPVDADHPHHALLVFDYCR